MMYRAHCTGSDKNMFRTDCVELMMGIHINTSVSAPS